MIQLRETMNFRNEAKAFSSTLFKNALFLTMLSVFIVGKLSINLHMGATLATSLCFRC